MRSLVALLALTATAHAEPEELRVRMYRVPHVVAGATAAIGLDDRLSVFESVQLGYRMSGNTWVIGSLGFAATGLVDPAGSGEGDSSGFETQVGAGKLRWGPMGGFGVVGSLGLHHHRTEYSDGLANPPMYTEERDLLFVEGRAFAGLRVTDFVLIELSLGLRLGGVVHSEHYDKRVTGGIVGGVGASVTL